MQVLIVEDDSVLRARVAAELEQRGLSATTAGDLGTARTLVGSSAFDIVIVDIRLPDGSGLELLDALRSAESTAHVIVLTGPATEDIRVRVLELGADDHLAHPFSTRELAARVMAVVRRRGGHQLALRYDRLEIDVRSRTVVVAGTPVALTAKEFDLLAFLATRAPRVFSRDELLKAVWQSSSEWQSAATVTEHIRRLRVKLEPDPRRPRLLMTVNRAGYRFDPPPVPLVAPDRRAGAASLVPTGARAMSVDVSAACAAVAHDLAGPVTILADYAELLAIGAEPALRDDALNAVRRAARQTRIALALVTDVAALDAGDLEIVPKPVSLREVVTDAVELTEARGEHPVDLDLPDVVVDGDADRLVILLSSVLGSAFERSAPDGTVTVCGEQARGRVTVRVAADGPGVPADAGERLFRRLDRVAHQPIGNGADLYLARGIARAHGGELSCRPAADGGTDFAIELPLFAAGRTDPGLSLPDPSAISG